MAHGWWWLRITLPLRWWQLRGLHDAQCPQHSLSSKVIIFFFFISGAPAPLDYRKIQDVDGKVMWIGAENEWLSHIPPYSLFPFSDQPKKKYIYLLSNKESDGNSIDCRSRTSVII